MRTYFEVQSHATLINVKKAFERITINLESSQRKNSTKKRIMIALLNEIINCYTGVYNHVGFKDQLESENSIEIWLAKFRKLIIIQLAQQHAVKNNINEFHRTHIEDVFFITCL